VFDGNDEKTEPFSYLTRRDEYEPPIPSPPQREVEEAARKGIDKNTGLTTQPKWLSVLKKRQGPWFWIRWLCCNCFCNPRWSMTRAQWLWFVNLICLGLHVWYCSSVWGLTLSHGEDFEATIWRIMPMWNATVEGRWDLPEQGHTAVLVDNLRPIRVDLVVGGYFLISAFFHALAVALGPFDRWIWIYWRQLDLCFHWWRWYAPYFNNLFPMLPSSRARMLASGTDIVVPPPCAQARLLHHAAHGHDDGLLHHPPA